MTTTTTFDATTFQRAIETRDAETQLDGYTHDAELTIVDRDHPPSQPTVLRGTHAIGAYLRDIAARDMTRQVGDLITSPEQLSFVQHCRYPDGTAVLCAAVATLRAGQITRQLAIQVWDT